MRFDNFDFFWEKFGKQIEQSGINKESARNFFNSAFPTLRVEKTEYLDGGGYPIIHFVDESVAEADRDTCAYLYDAICIDDKVYVRPLNTTMPSNELFEDTPDLDTLFVDASVIEGPDVSTVSAKTALFADGKIKCMSTESGELVITDYDVTKTELTTSVYDSEARRFIGSDPKKKSISFDEIGKIEERLKDFTIIPDAKVELYYGYYTGATEPFGSKHYISRVSTADDEYELECTDLVFHNPSNTKYTDLVSATNKGLSRYYSGNKGKK